MCDEARAPDGAEPSRPGLGRCVCRKSSRAALVRAAAKDEVDASNNWQRRSTSTLFVSSAERTTRADAAVPLPREGRRAKVLAAEDRGMFESSRRGLRRSVCTKSRQAVRKDAEDFYVEN